MYTTARRLLRRLTFPKCRVRVATARFRRAEQNRRCAREKKRCMMGYGGSSTATPNRFHSFEMFWVKSGSKIMAIYDNLNITIFLGVTVHMVSICVLILRDWKTHFGRWVCFKSVRYFAWRLSGPPLDTTLCLCFPGGTTSLFGDSIVKHKGILPCSLWKMISAQPLSGGSRMRLIQAQALQRWQDPREGKTSQKAKHLTDLTASDVWFWRHQLHRDSSPHPAFGKISWRSWSPFEMWYWYVLVRVLVLVLLFHEDFSNSVSSKSRLRLGGSPGPTEIQDTSLKGNGALQNWGAS